MATKAKRKNDKRDGNDSSSDNSMCEDDGDSEKEMMGDQEVEVDFEAKPPTDGDYNGIERLLNQLFIKPHINVKELTELIIQEASISSVIKQCDVTIEEDEDEDEDEDETFGVMSVINLSQKNINCIKEIISHLLEEAKSCCVNNAHKSIKALLENPKKVIGLLISERMVNIPPQISIPLFETLRNDLKESQRKKTKQHNFTDFILISKVHKIKESNSVVYSNAEDEIFKENGNLLFEYSVSSKINASTSNDEGVELQPARHVIHFPAENFDIFTSKLSEAFR